MKKTLQKIGLLATLLGSTMAAFAGPGISYAPVSSSFINNGTFVAISNNVPYLFDTASNVWFAPFQTFTNVYAGTTNGNSIGLTWPQAFVDVAIPPDGSGEANANLAICVVMGITNNFWSFAGAYQNTNAGPIANNVQSPVIRNLIATNNINAAIGSSTNTLTFTFAPVIEPFNLSMPSSGWVSDKTFTFSVAGTNTQAVVFTTNLPSTFTQGATKIRLIKVGIDNLGGASPPAGIVIDALNLRGWTP